MRENCVYTFGIKHLSLVQNIWIEKIRKCRKQKYAAKGNDIESAVNHMKPFLH